MSVAPPPPPGAPSFAARTYDAAKIYGVGETEVRALDGVTVGFESGRFTAIMGPSGSGKSTLVQCVAGLDRLTSGRVFIGDEEITAMNAEQLTLLRRRRIGFVFQAFNLVRSLTAEKNIRLPFKLAKSRAGPGAFDRVVTTLQIEDRLVAQAVGALGRPAAAGRGGPGAGDPAGDPHRRRTDGNLDSRSSARDARLHPRRGRLARPVGRDGDPRPARRGRVPTGWSILADGRIADDVTGVTAEDLIERMKQFGQPQASDGDALMFELAWENLKANKGRLIATVVAIVTGIAFLSSGLMFTDAIRSSLGGAVDQQYPHVDAAVVPKQDRGDQTRLPATLVPKVEAVDGVKSAVPDLSGPVNLLTPGQAEARPADRPVVARHADGVAEPRRQR